MKYWPIAILLLVLACESKTKVKTVNVGGKTLPLKYAEGFSISYNGPYTIVEVSKPYQGASTGFRYLLVPKDASVPDTVTGMKIVRTPISSIVCTSTTHIPLLDYLDVSETLIGFPTTDYISSVKTRQFVDQGKVTDLGVDKGINLEKLAMLKPDVVMGYTMSSDYGQFKKMEDLGIPVILNAEYLERHPLGRAEWIKFMAAFYGLEKEADSVFTEIENSYNTTVSLVNNIQSRPTVLSGILYGDAWFLPGGQNYASKILKDAGCHYLWENDSTYGYLELSFESVYAKAYNADLWIGVGPFSSLETLSAGDHRYSRFRPFQEKQVYAYDGKIGSKGGNEYLELGYLRPDLILKDLVKIAHPEVLPDYILYFHRKID